MSSNCSHGTQMNPKHGLAVPSIRFIAPATEPTKTVDSGTKPTTKRKSSLKNPNQVASKILRAKQPKKSPKKAKGPSTPEAKCEKKDVDIENTNIDFSRVPSPYCSCTGVARVCYKWGSSGWQSSCCATNVSEYPLPMSSKRRGVRIAGRKMSNGAYGKLLVKLAAKGHDLTGSVDLKNHWARHGTNKFVTIK
ncbi:Protein BASIC like [Quillaja saponaria]|uniref:GAGA-binding transcriptional activator n=1 Tax=Quillaja saponaria TaxID=32244 RepID=A0AAD7L8H0_QUISA|nr:Protein BASIC like [Quillaja saponaria]